MEAFLLLKLFLLLFLLLNSSLKSLSSSLLFFSSFLLYLSSENKLLFPLNKSFILFFIQNYNNNILAINNKIPIPSKDYNYANDNNWIMVTKFTSSPEIRFISCSFTDINFLCPLPIIKSCSIMLLSLYSDCCKQLLFFTIVVFSKFPFELIFELFDPLLALH